MSNRAHKLHKWFAVVAGAMFLMWIVSGIVMILPQISLGIGKKAPVRTDFRSVDIAPAEAIQSLDSLLEKRSQVSDVKLIKILDTILYQVNLTDGDSHLIDGRSGKEVNVTEQMAIEIATRKVPSSVGVLKIEIFSKHNSEYGWGPLPVYKVIFDDSHGTIVYISKKNGAERHTNTLKRIRGFIGGLHEFSWVKLITDSKFIRKGLLVLFSLIGIGAACSGYYLAWRGR